MLNQIVEEFVKIKEKDILTKNTVMDLISSLKSELLLLEENVADDVSKTMLDIPQSEYFNVQLDKTNKKIEEKGISKNFNSIYNNFYGSLTKFGKILSKNLEKEEEPIRIFPYNKKLFYQVLVKDLYRKGDFKTADALIKDSKIQFDQNFRYIFSDLNVISTDLKDRNLESVVEWCKKHKDKLEKLKSPLPFETLKLSVICFTNIVHSFY